MKPAEIRYQLDLKNTSQTDIAEKLNVNSNFVSRVINRERTSKRIANAISEALDLPLEKVFPSYAASKAA